MIAIILLSAYNEMYRRVSRAKAPIRKFFEVIQYIKNHDTGTVKRMAKKSRLEKLLEMV